MKINIYNKLRKYEKYLYTAYKADYIRSLTTKEVDDLIAIGNELGISYNHRGCPVCLLKFIKQVAKPYYEQKDKFDAKIAEAVDGVDDKNNENNDNDGNNNEDN